MSKKQDAYYFNNFLECAQCACEAASLLEEIAGNFQRDKLREYMDKMHVVEHSGDLKKHELVETLVKAFITPIDREDILQLSQNIDDLTDKIEDVLIRIYCTHVSAIRPDALPLIQLVRKLCDNVLELLREFTDFKHSKKLKSLIISINTLEEEADALYIQCMHDLHSCAADPMEVIAWRDIYTYLERCADTAEHIADSVESVIMKNA